MLSLSTGKSDLQKVQTRDVVASMLKYLLKKNQPQNIRPGIEDSS